VFLTHTLALLSADRPKAKITSTDDLPLSSIKPEFALRASERLSPLAHTAPPRTLAAMTAAMTK
jgi:hypothetical protein